jgi:hypothetical protein
MKAPAMAINAAVKRSWGIRNACSAWPLHGYKSICPVGNHNGVSFFNMAAKGWHFGTSAHQPRQVAVAEVVSHFPNKADYHLAEHDQLATYDRSV